MEHENYKPVGEPRRIGIELDSLRRGFFMIAPPSDRAAYQPVSVGFAVRFRTVGWGLGSACFAALASGFVPAVGWRWASAVPSALSGGVSVPPASRLSLPVSCRLSGGVWFRRLPCCVRLSVGWRWVSGRGSALFSSPSGYKICVLYNCPRWGNYKPCRVQNEDFV